MDQRRMQQCLVPGALVCVLRRTWALALGVVALCGASLLPVGSVLAGPLPVASWTLDWIVPIGLVLLAAAAHPVHPRPWTALVTWCGCAAWGFGAVLADGAGC